MFSYVWWCIFISLIEKEKQRIVLYWCICFFPIQKFNVIFDPGLFLTRRGGEKSWEGGCWQLKPSGAIGFSVKTKISRKIFACRGGPKFLGNVRGGFLPPPLQISPTYPSWNEPQKVGLLWKKEKKSYWRKLSKL